MAPLRERQRKAMNKDVFAYVDDSGEGHLPLNDKSHVRNAMARFNQTSFETKTDKERARRKIVGAARKRGIEVSKKDNVARPSTSLRGARTRRGMRGGRKSVAPKRRTTAAQRTAARRNIRNARQRRRAA